jgi:methanogenesis imperfect marker protein 11
MISCTPEMVKARFGSLFCQKFLVMVDDSLQMAEILEQCRARGPVEWDAVNRMRAGGAVVSCTVEGCTLSLMARIGMYPVHFGAASRDIGGQALEGVEVSGDEVITTWAGIAGAGVGVAACLPQAPGVVRAEFPSEEDLTVGGARENRVRIITPRYEKVTFGIDDTDTREQGATWVMALKCAESVRIPGVEFLNMRLVQLNPEVPKKTTNCVGSALNFAVRPGSIDDLEAYVKAFIEANTYSRDTGIAVFRGLRAGREHPIKERVKNSLVTQDEAESAARELSVSFIDSFRGKGRIGALGAVLWSNEGISAAGLYGDPH